MVSSSLKMQISEYFDDFENYDSYYKGPWKYYRQRFINIIRIKYLKEENIKILDLGCGRMCSLPELLFDSNIIAYHCVDSSPKSLEVLKDSFSGNKKVKIYESDIIDFVDACKENYDIIILFGVIMYLTRPNAIKLFSGLNRLLTKGAMILLHEPNEKAKNGLDQYGYVMTYKFLNSLISLIPDAGIKKIENYDIIGFRKPISFLSRLFRKILKKISIKNGFIFLNLNKFEDYVWYLESLLETILAKTKLGCDYLIVVEKSKLL